MILIHGTSWKLILTVSESGKEPDKRLIYLPRIVIAGALALPAGPGQVSFMCMKKCANPA
jgi:hypothetical protein